MSGDAAPLHAAVLAAALTALLCDVATAQVPGGAERRGVHPAGARLLAYVAPHAPRDTTRRARHLAPAVVASAMPSTFLVVAVPRPAGLDSLAPLAFEVTPTGIATVIGERAGTLAGDSLLVTFGIPRAARAGRSTAAHVRFRAPGGAALDVPIELDVGVVRRVSLVLTRDRHGADVGGQVAIAWRVHNEGNAPDSIALGLELPPGWRRTGRERRIVVDAGRAAEGTLRVQLPPSATPGTRRLEVIVTSGGEVRARSAALVEVTDARLAGRRAGARVSAGVATVLDGGREASTVAALELMGQLTDSVRVQGRFLSEQTPDAAALRGLSRVGFGGTPWYLVLDAPDWRADLGAVHVGFTPLTGLSATGTGAEVSLDRGAWAATLLGAGAAPGERHGSADYVGARVTRWFDSLRVGTTISHLVERSELGRSLDAVGLDMSGPFAFGTSLAGELAWRSHERGRGIGWATELSRRGEDGDWLRLRASAAPGGSAAFARGVRELSAGASRRLTRTAALGGAVWRTHDESARSQRLTVSGWSFAPRLVLSERSALSLEVAGTDFESRTDVAGFGSGERRAALVADVRWRSLFASSRIQHGLVERTVEMSSGAGYRTTASRTSWHGSLAAGGDWGVVDVTALLERNQEGAGYEPRRNEVQLRLQSPTIPAGRTELLLRGELHHFGWFGDRASIAVVRAAVDVQLPWRVRVTLDTERNPLFSAIGGGSAWSTTLRVTRSATLPRFFVEHAAEGSVYQDLNANGRRDAGEPGLRSALVRYGESFATTDARGRFAFDVRQGGAPRLDIRSVPLGWIVTGAATGDDGRRTDIGVAPTAALRVTVRLDTTSSDLVPRVSWPLVRVIVRNQAGREWAAPVDRSGAAFLDALPAGRYGITLDLSRLSEPMTVSGDATFTIDAESRALERALVLRPRPIRIREIAPPPGDGAMIDASAVHGALR